MFQYKPNTDVSRLTISSVSLVAIRFMCAFWQSSHYFQPKLFSCGPVSTTISLVRVAGIFHWKNDFSWYDMITLSKKFCVYGCVAIPLQYSFRNMDDTFAGWGREERITTEFKKKKKSKCFSCNSFFIFYFFLSLYNHWTLHRFGVSLADCPNSQ